MAFLLCCRAPRSHSPTVVLPDSERLCTLRPASVVSVPLPLDTVPHRPTTGSDEIQALRDIFGASPTSHRGYQAAAQSSGSFDAHFEFGHGSPTRSRTKPRRSLDKLGHNIRQRLSQSRLSNYGSGRSVKDIKSTETVVRTELLPISRTSTGLNDLLISRTVSQGGYDSDARDIRTPSSTKASGGSVLVSDAYAAKILNALESSRSQKSPSLSRMPRNDGGNDHSSTNLGRTPSITMDCQESLDAVQPVLEVRQQIKARSMSTPEKPSTPQRESFSALLQLRPQESPADVLRRLSVGLANGTVKLPATPELRAMRMPSTVEELPEWRLSFAAPKRASSLHQGDPAVKQALETLVDRVEKAKKNIAQSDLVSTDQNSSLPSDLDQALLRHFSHYRNEEQCHQLHVASGEVRDEVKDGGTFDETSIRDMTSSHAGTGGLCDINSEQMHVVGHKADASCSEDYSQRRGASLHSKESIHLFDMRISQRLASTSIVPTVSPSRTNLNSNHQYTDRKSPNIGQLSRSTTFIGRTSAEHVRKPSDPSTRRLFEPDCLLDRGMLHPKWKSMRSASSSNTEGRAHGSGVSRDDASSVYMVGAGHEDTCVIGAAPHRARSESKCMPESFPLVGRQALLGVTVDHRRNSMGQMSSTNGQGKTMLARGVQHVGGKESKFCEDFASLESKTAGKIECEGGHGLAKTSMNSLGYMPMTRPEIDLHQTPNELDFLGALDKKLEASVQRRHNTDASQDESTWDVSPSNRPLVKHRMTETGGEPTVGRLRGQEECATNMWERAFRTATRDSNSRSSIGQPGRDQSCTRRLSGSRTFHDHSTEGPATVATTKSRSVTPDNAASSRPYKESFNLDKHQLLCVETRKPLTPSTSPARSIKIKKRSFLDIGRLAMAGSHKSDKTAKSSPAGASPVRDFLAWARFPSHSRLERNGAATGKDGVTTRDFSPTANTDTWSRKNPSKLSLATQLDDLGANTPGSWRLLKFGNGRKKSRSMNFALSDSAQTERKREKMKKKSSMLPLALSFAKWRRSYRCHSNDLRRFRAGHRSSISVEGKVEFPELEIVSGYDGGNGPRTVWRATGKSEEDCQGLKREGGEGRSNLGPCGLPEMGFGNPTSWSTEGKGKNNLRQTASTSDLGWWEGRRRTSSSAEMRQRTPTEYRHGAAAEAENENVWAEVYQACVVNANDDPNEKPIDSSAGLRSSNGSASAVDINQQMSGSRKGQHEDSYVSCSVAVSDDITLPSRRSADRNVDGDRSFPAGKGIRDRDCDHQGVCAPRLASSPPLRDSTIDFRLQLQEEERRVREELLSKLRDGEDGRDGRDDGRG